MAAKFKTIGLVWRDNDIPDSGYVNRLTSFLHNHDCKTISTHIEPHAEKRTLHVHNKKELGEQCDLVICMGGDGTLLCVARELVDYEIPLLCINLGRLGFLADLSPEEAFKVLPEILDGHYDEESRIMLTTSVSRNGELVHQGDAFNDVVIHKWNTSRLIEFETHVDNRLINSQRADGLIVATPTGSTAYSLSVGGPIVYPTMKAFLLVPIAPHRLTNRPIVIDGDSVVDIRIIDKWSSLQVSCDGQPGVPLEYDDHVRIDKKNTKIKLLHPTSHNYFQTLRAKLHWGR